MANHRSIEVKVGLLILVAIAILTGFVLIMGGINFQPTYTVYVDFDNPGGVQVGAPCKIAGVKVGTVKEISFRGGMKNAATGVRDPLVRLTVAIEKRHEQAIHANAVFYVTTQGVLGEQFLAIDPGSIDQPVLPEGAAIRGLDPPRLDMLLAEGYDLLHSAVQSIQNNRKEISEAFDGLHDTLRGTGDFFKTNQSHLNDIITHADKVAVDADDTINAGRARYIDNPQVQSILNNVDRASSSVAQHADSLLADAHETLANTKRLTAALGSDEEVNRIKHTVAQVEDVANRAQLTTTDVQAIVAHIRQGDGSIGSFVMSEQLYDDLQELVRDLKHNPWKFFWKE